MVGAVIDQNLSPPRHREGGVDRVGVRFRACHGEADQLHRRKALGQPPCNLRFVKIGAASKGVAVGHRVANSLLHGFGRKAKEPRRKITQQVR